MPEDKKQTLPPQTQQHQPGSESAMQPSPDFMPRFKGSSRLKGKAVLISGGDSGIGRAVAISMAREGASVMILYLDEHDDAKKTVELVKAEGGQAEAMAGDIGSETFCAQAVDHTIRAFGRIDVLVNNAAEQHMRQEDLSDIDEAALTRVFRTNIFSFFFLTKATLPHMCEGCSIINTTSITAYKGHSQLIDYSTTKGAIVSFTRSMAMVLAKRGIRVNAVAPGPIWTPLIPATFPAEKVSSHGGDTPMDRPGQPNEVASSFLFLACDDSSYMSGQVLHPNGGEVVGA